MTRLLKLTLLFVLALSVVACGGAEETAVVDPAPAQDAVAEMELQLAPAVDVQTVADLQGRDDVLLIDVREQWEYDEAHIPNITLIPMNEIPNRLSEIPTDKTVIVTCRSGNRSGQVTDFLRDQGYDNVHNMEGGILAWQQAGLPVE